MGLRACDELSCVPDRRSPHHLIQVKMEGARPCTIIRMKCEWRKYLTVRAPRYTSYPSALRFDDSVGAADYAERLALIGLYEPLNLYVHIPFCSRLCWYCGCNARVENRYDRVLDYVDALTGEIGLVGRLLGGRGRPVSIHFGGGTPNLLLTDDLARILDAIERELGLTDAARLAIELDPRLLREADIERLAALGFTRMSLGVQDFNAEVQRAINRMQSFELIESCVSAMRQAGIDDVAFDLVYGLPKQSLETFAVTISHAIMLAPDRMSVFGYAHLPAALPRQRKIRDEELPDPSMRSELAELADEMLCAAGYLRVGFDHYAKPHNSLARAAQSGKLRRNFQGFTDDGAETTIGFGASAISFVKGLYAQNQKTVRDYRAAVGRGALPVMKGVVRTPRDELAARTIERLLCAAEADLSGLFAALAPGERARILDALERLERDGVIRREGPVLTIHPDAWFLSRAVAAALDPVETGLSLAAQAV